MSFRKPALAALLTLALAPAAHAITFNFTPSLGKSTPLSLSSNGVTAMFNSSAGPGTFNVGATTGLFTIGNALGDFASFSGDPLTLTFSQPITQPVTASFGIEDQGGFFGADFLTVTANTGQTQTFGTALNSLTLTEPQGTINFAGTSAFTSLTITSANPFAIGNVSVPEPISLALLSTGLIGLGFARRRS